MGQAALPESPDSASRQRAEDTSASWGAELGPVPSPPPASVSSPPAQMKSCLERDFANFKKNTPQMLEY